MTANNVICLIEKKMIIPIGTVIDTLRPICVRMSATDTDDVYMTGRTFTVPDVILYKYKIILDQGHLGYQELVFITPHQRRFNKQSIICDCDTLVTCRWHRPGMPSYTYLHVRGVKSLLSEIMYDKTASQLLSSHQCVVSSLYELTASGSRWELSSPIVRFSKQYDRMLKHVAAFDDNHHVSILGHLTDDVVYLTDAILDCLNDAYDDSEHHAVEMIARLSGLPVMLDNDVILSSNSMFKFARHQDRALSATLADNSKVKYDGDIHYNVDPAYINDLYTLVNVLANSNYLTLHLCNHSTSDSEFKLIDFKTINAGVGNNHYNPNINDIACKLTQLVSAITNTNINNLNIDMVLTQFDELFIEIRSKDNSVRDLYVIDLTLLALGTSGLVNKGIQDSLLITF